MPVSKEDNLRNPDAAYLPDSRNHAFGLKKISDQYTLISEFVLADYVPEKVVIQFEVARNLYLYAFNVYRFYMVAQHQALVVLEFAIKECFGRDEIERYGKEINKGRGLAACLCYVFDEGFVVNNDFPIWLNRHRMDAEYHYQMQKIEEMQEKKLDSIALNYDEIDYEAHSLEYDYLSVIGKTMPFTRNLHAHGTTLLHNQVLNTFENVSVIINKIYKPAVSKASDID